MDTETAQELNALFSSSLTTPHLEPDVLSELQSIMLLHSLPAQELFYKWESYCMKMDNNDMKLDIESVRALKKDVQDDLERESRNKAHVLSSSKKGKATPRTARGGDVFGILDGLVPNTPRPGGERGNSSTAKRKTALETPSFARTKAEPGSSPAGFKTPYKAGENGVGKVVSFHDRANAGQAIEVLNDQLQLPEPPIAPYSDPRIKLTAGSDIKKLSYKTMAMKSSEASEILDDRMDDFMHLVQEYHKLDDSAFGSAASQSTSEVVSVGRIASDSPEGKLNSSSLVLETSRRIGAGLRVPLDMGNVGFQFFPGQIVALRGINASGDKFTVSEILDMPLLGSAASTPAGLEDHRNRLKGGADAMDTDSDPAPLSILLGSGPYTTDDNLDFEPLHALCSQAADMYADCLILNGPFVDVDHPLIALGDFDLPEEAMGEPDTVTMSTVFKYLISPAFQQLATANPKITIVLVPSVKDAISTHTAWPQPPFPKQDLGLPKCVRIVGNPMTLALNEIAVGISSQDILSELRHEEVTGGNGKEEAMLARFPKYLIEQRHFFPLFPPMVRRSLPKAGTEEGTPAGAMLDTSYLKLGEMLNTRPDMLITPSALPPFARVVESVVVVNPGYLAKRRAAGTYAKLTIYPPSLSDEEKNLPRVVHKLYERVRVDVMRI